ncbi:hypothetical protein TSOC_001922 [Tetrabaena socialis]|uniref:Uncharacterized protein n=1 Tax=Tetrabaena socialis TaxID=47790 RepID=A0A2J8AFE1_9CHLO|nr:hypothetical protein TSOC_001922 [Tetrabaena socialis]|eukprot:PNH11239.1 hypothetical protein TSOC_001922 [Tetrabaena socialis]
MRGASGAASLGPSSLAAASALSAALPPNAAWPAAAAARWLASSGPARSQQTPKAPKPASPAPSPAPPAPPPGPLNFSLRPSALSLLFPTWLQARHAAARRDHLLALLSAHELLATGLPPADKAHVLIPLLPTI